MPEVIYVATRNPHKVDEFRALLAGVAERVEPLPDGTGECPENGVSFEANAVEKAVYYARFCPGWVLADDSGLCVDALDGAPGVRSARYAGVHGDSAANNRKLLAALADVPPADRRAQFVCAIAVWHREARRGWVVRGEVPGYIAQVPAGAGGFGYDPLFWLPELGRTFAELSAEEKNRWSHRARAVQALLAVWGRGDVP
ncbi:RdgB/HAM1 family non-canonical purine NTP pyrophosphatase [Alicyclobacillus sp.]|uniref:RdgB/HAM1 family non-canonical purine NTP pyrophosphatase n=1 Tax=Alicyclobacillus sp. TaxID=61169 RepID=UPI0025BAE9E2|nr:RdgB/HAM1 family non-canonical purine NTP pyrophosphatase [Alicyclobacillus sp.]MCL6516586.1 RdgB/HAM1 family non-canonical purine NTP pyrophosphatase [Alicyclobacillus sp.]